MVVRRREGIEDMEIWGVEEEGGESEGRTMREDMGLVCLWVRVCAFSSRRLLSGLVLLVLLMCQVYVPESQEWPKKKSKNQTPMYEYLDFWKFELWMADFWHLRQTSSTRRHIGVTPLFRPTCRLTNPLTRPSRSIRPSATTPKMPLSATTRK